MFLKRLLFRKRKKRKEDPIVITVNPNTDDPTAVWKSLLATQIVKAVEPLHLDKPISKEKLRFVCISDTHNQLRHVKVPPGDVLIHAGDFSDHGRPIEVNEFNECLGALPHPVKIVIAGNHDITFHDDLVKYCRKELKLVFRLHTDGTRGLEGPLQEYGVESCKDLLTNCMYLEDSVVDVCGVKIYGSPWQPTYQYYGFYVPRGKHSLDKWNLIPDNTDILVTHGPPVGFGDRCFDGNRAGCVELLSTVQKRVKPKYHVFGHIHEDYGITTDDTTTFINASICDIEASPTRCPIIFDLNIPAGHSKGELSLFKKEILFCSKEVTKL